MKQLIFFLFLFFLLSCAEKRTISNGIKSQKIMNQKSKIISFTTIIDIKNATKDGVYLNDYIVEMEYSRIKELNEKKVRITGKVTIVSGIEEKEETDTIIMQGRIGMTKHILDPIIEILNDKKKH